MTTDKLTMKDIDRIWEACRDDGCEEEATRLFIYVAQLRKHITLMLARYPDKTTYEHGIIAEAGRLLCEGQPKESFEDYMERCHQKVIVDAGPIEEEG